MIVVLLTLIGILVNPFILFPFDILNFIPSYTEKGWSQVHNFLLADPVYQFIPWWYFARSEILEGRIPLINNLNGLSTPFLANPQTSLFYPLTFLFYFLPIKISLFLIPIIKLLGYGIFTFLYLRSVGIGKEISILLSAVLGTSGFFMMWLLWPHTNVFLLFPLILYIIERLLKKESLNWYALTSISIFVAILGGHPETLFNLVIVTSLYCLIRCWDIRIILKFVGSITIGFLLGAFVLLPFIGYLLESYAFVSRTSGSQLNVLESIYLIFPFLSGLPQTNFYRPFIEGSNFQEEAGGYTGLLIATLGLLGILKIKKNKVVLAWIVIGIISFVLSFRMLPFDMFSFLPFFNKAANQRFIPFIGFALTVIAGIYITKKIKFPIFHRWDKRLLFPFIVVLIGFLMIFLVNKTTSKVEYGVFLLIVTIIYALTTYIMLRLLNGKKSPGYLVLFSTVIIMQTSALFINYIPITTKYKDFPENKIVKSLRNLPKGKILEVGNPVIPENTNLLYGLEKLQNNDAIRNHKFQSLFESNFKINQWGLANEINNNQIKLFGIDYIVSDYDVRLKKQTISSEADNVLPPLINKRKYVTEVLGNGQHVSQIRILPATFNRVNSCNLLFELKEEYRVVRKKIINCTDLRDNMYFVIEFEKFDFQVDKKYQLEFSSTNNSQNNNIALMGKDSQPFLEILLKNDKIFSCKFIKQTKYVYLYRCPNTTYLYKIVQDYPSSKKIIVEGKGGVSRFEILNSHGWSAAIDGRKADIIKNDFVISLRIPPGKHLVSLVYQPSSLIIGLFISALTACIFIAVIISSLLRHNNFTTPHQIKKFNIRLKGIKWTEHFTFFLFIIPITFLATSLVVESLPLQKTSVYEGINWLSVNNYSKHADYVRIVFTTISTLVISLGGWTLFIWTRK